MSKYSELYTRNIENICIYMSTKHPLTEQKVLWTLGNPWFMSAVDYNLLSSICN